MRKAGYIAIFVAATIVFLAASLHPPLSSQGPAGSGQSQLAYAVAAAANTTIEWLQCYEGINEDEAIGKFDESLQRLCVELKAKAARVDWELLKSQLYCQRFLQCWTASSRTAIRKSLVCLLIDELDKVDHAFETMQLELQSVWQLSISKLGTLQPKSIPFVVLTSNEKRRIGDPLRRRSFYLRVEGSAV